MKPTSLEPRRPKLEKIDTSNVGGTEGQNLNMIEETYSCDETCELQNHPIDNPGWKGKAGGRGGVPKRQFLGQNETTARSDKEKQDSFAKTRSTDDILRGGEDTGQNKTTPRTEKEEQDSFAGTNFTYIFKRPLAPALPTVSD